ncbi:MAG: hypothetical protein LBJ39_06935 [Tannerellaceae bacterium]|nr:hypothetical protein [Tannerellaceae bacterium]
MIFPENDDFDKNHSMISLEKDDFDKNHSMISHEKDDFDKNHSMISIENDDLGKNHSMISLEKAIFVKSHSDMIATCVVGGRKMFRPYIDTVAFYIDIVRFPSKPKPDREWYPCRGEKSFALPNPYRRTLVEKTIFVKSHTDMIATCVVVGQKMFRTYIETTIFT